MNYYFKNDYYRIVKMDQNRQNVIKDKKIHSYEINHQST